MICKCLQQQTCTSSCVRSLLQQLLHICQEEAVKNLLLEAIPGSDRQRVLRLIYRWTCAETDAGRASWIARRGWHWPAPVGRI